MILDELEFVKAQLARLPTRSDQAFTPLTIVVTTAFGTVALPTGALHTSRRAAQARARSIRNPATAGQKLPL